MLRKLHWPLNLLLSILIALFAFRKKRIFIALLLGTWVTTESTKVDTGGIRTSNFGFLDHFLDIASTVICQMIAFVENQAKVLNDTLSSMLLTMHCLDNAFNKVFGFEVFCFLQATMMATRLVSYFLIYWTMDI